METFAISKSTALRDIQELETLGMSLYVENGRYGGYRVLQKRCCRPFTLVKKKSLPFFIPYSY